MTDHASPAPPVGAAMAASALAFFSAMGFAPAGRVPWLIALVFAAGVVLVALRPAERPANARATHR